MSIPDWVYDAVFYQIFPDRFANGDASNDPPNVQAWGAKPTLWGFQGGDLRGVIQQFDYFLDLGVNALYFNPIFLASANHRYNTSDYFRIDPKLGTKQDLAELLALAHQHEMHVILDGVFNHCGRGFFAFNDVLENREHSPYRDWFHIRHFPVRAYVDGRAEDYQAWWGFPSLPKFNTDNPGVRNYILDVARTWIEFGADGWRLDVPNEIDDDRFWAAFRQTVKEVNPEAYLVGEIWEVNDRWVGENHFDGLMNYPLRDSLRAFLVEKTMTPSAFAKRITVILQAYPEPYSFGHMLSLGSHDTRRLRNICADDLRLVKLFFLFQFFYPGAPHIFYGDEIGLPGEKDPDCRRAFPWDEATWNHDLRSFVRTLIQIRKQRLELRRGAFQVLLADDQNEILVCSRERHGSISLALLNRSASSQEVQIDLAQWVQDTGVGISDAVRGGELQAVGGQLRLQLEPLEGTILLLQR